MWQIVDAAGSSESRRGELARFVESLHSHEHFFDRGNPVFVSRAPGRLDVMGGVADYSGSLVLQFPLEAATFVAAQGTNDGLITVHSDTAAGIGSEPTVSINASLLAPDGIPLEYDDARALLTENPRRAWAAYPVGTLVALARERGTDIRRGMRMLIASTVPAGKGVSSSAALEVSSMAAVSAALGVNGDALSSREVALLCQRVENLVVGAPCGVMDQMTSECGEQGKLLALLCQPAELLGNVALPAGLEVWGIDSGIRHSIGARTTAGGVDFTSVRTGAFMGYRMIADIAGCDVVIDEDGLAHVRDRRWGKYLANVTPQEWESEFRDWIPESIDGATFLRRFGGITDVVTRVDPSRRYAVRSPAAHPIYEHHRVRRFRELLEQEAAMGKGVSTTAIVEAMRTELGALMYASHASYSACGLDSDGTDTLVEMVRTLGAAKGFYGAKITGGGSGGTVAVLARRGSSEVVHAIAQEYERDTGRAAMVLGGSSPGAAASGIVRLEWT